MCVKLGTLVASCLRVCIRTLDIRYYRENPGRWHRQAISCYWKTTRYRLANCDALWAWSHVGGGVESAVSSPIHSFHHLSVPASSESQFTGDHPWENGSEELQDQRLMPCHSREYAVWEQLVVRVNKEWLKVAGSYRIRKTLIAFESWRSLWGLSGVCLPLATCEEIRQERSRILSHARLPTVAQVISQRSVQYREITKILVSIEQLPWKHAYRSSHNLTLVLSIS